MADRSLSYTLKTVSVIVAAGFLSGVAVGLLVLAPG